MAANGRQLADSSRSKALCVGLLRQTAVIGCPSFGMINLKTKIKCQKKNKQQ